MIRRVLAVAVKELLQLRRDWRTTFALVAMPVVLLLIYGFALSFDVRDIRLAVVDQSRTRASRGVIEAFLQSGYFVRVADLAEPRPLDRLFDRGTAQAALVIPADFGADVAGRRQTTLQFVLDGSDSQTASTVLGYARQIVGSATSGLYGLAVQPPVVARPLVWYNPDLSSSLFLVPGLVAFILMVTSVIATALAVVREKERGTLESLRATPLVAIELLVGKTVPYLLLASAAAAGSLILAWALFGVPVHGSIVWLGVATVLFLAGGLGWGMFLSSLADSQQVAFQLGLLTSMLPTLLLSGFIFPISSMPPALQLISHIVPARYFISALRAIVLKGAGPEVWWSDALALIAFGAVVLVLATVRTVRSL
ncbi:MAG TPA: ABC transporter permease [Thermoanaerobaculales bacterium]|nr:ABC transporter permease [Thermoanaerobaculales bacterium]HPA82294.1 ABC transporter permease [Thermoanaerobaculales bacterium]HQL28986.1 ABC transporter permease [Thermoanaerobaculales bacterium]HQN96248.1 ABC transporter permease [Thermoanaerobaculales bacterium]HQP42299.1 ABC transporter permease [Thermoanaerobaculales bacterium]